MALYSPPLMMTSMMRKHFISDHIKSIFDIIKLLQAVRSV